MPGRRPNIVLLISDNQRLDTLGLLGRTPCRTPTWDGVARQGVVFESLRCTSPMCSPTRASIFTGFQPHQAGMPHLPFSSRVLLGEEELYNIAQDPHELDNRAGQRENRHVKIALREALVAWSRRTGDPFAERISSQASQGDSTDG